MTLAKPTKPEGWNTGKIAEKLGNKYTVQDIEKALADFGNVTSDDELRTFEKTLQPATGKLAKSTKSNGLTRKTLERKAKSVEEIPINIPTVEPVQIQRNPIAAQWVDTGSQLAVAAQQTVAALAVNQEVAAKVGQLQQIVDDDLVVHLLRAHAAEVMEVFGLTSEAELLDGTPADRLDLWNQYQEYKREQIERTQATINQLLSFDPVARYRSAANA